MGSVEVDALEAGILADQLDDLKTGLFFSMPISSALSACVLFVETVSGGGIAAAIWFVVVNAINIARIALAFKPLPQGEGNDARLRAATKQLRLYSVLALLSGIAWCFLALTTEGYTTSQAQLYLIILTGISAGSVVYGTSYATATISFTTPPLLVTAGCLFAKGGVQDNVLGLAVLLFLGGLARSSFLGQARFREGSRLKHLAERTAADMERSSREDPLTGLLNRRGLEHAVERLSATDGPYMTMLIDLDGFKSVNDTYGHKIGDEVLARIARKIEGEVEQGTTLARIGGDEFVVLFPAARRAKDAGKVASRIIASIASPDPGVVSVQVGACVGIYLSETPHLTEMLLRADSALYSAKRLGRNEFYLFDDKLESELQRKQCIERDLRTAIETRELGVLFQPIVRIESGTVVGFEALLRWFHPVHGTIAPPEIVTAARETGMLQRLTDTVFHGCCGLIDELAKAGCRDIRVAMNLSPRELEAGNIDDLILSGMKTRNLPLAMLEIEVTEEAPVDSDRVNAKLERLSHAGISIALDDFGTGFSTLASLKDGRIRKVKIDKAFIRGLADSREDQALVKAVIELGTSLGIEVMAEGVETEADRKTLVSLGCRTAQGYLFSKAIPPAQALEWAVGQQAARNASI